jgi:hypothetical protein
MTPRQSQGYSRRPTAARIVAAQQMLAGSLRGKKMREALKSPQPIEESELA